MSETGFVVGNGPSLRGFDLTRLDPAVTIGMNAAYRHWHEIGWYPRYYCCLDDQLIETHHAEIDRLYTGGLVHEFFLHGHFFELHPERIGNPAFLSFDQVSPHWHGQRGKKMGLPFIDHPAFRSSDTSKVTTGAYAVRYMAYAGFCDIALLGIDLRLAEMMPQERAVQGAGPVMTELPGTAPNAFQAKEQTGDPFNFPTLSAHEVKLHLASFELVRDDFSANGVLAEVVDTNPNSLLREHRVFPLRDLDTVLTASRTKTSLRLGAIVVPCTRHDVDQIIANLNCWSEAAYAPFVGAPPADRPTLVLVFNNASASEHAARVEEAFAQLPVRAAFDRLEVFYLDLEGARDSYIRSSDIVAPQYGYKAGPNNQFFGAMTLARRFGSHVFLMEADCVPVRAGWIARLQEIAACPDTFWVLGSAYRGVDMLDRTLCRHINGNALYASGNRRFQLFLKRVWEPTLWQIVQKLDSRAAYDFAIDYLHVRMRSDVGGDRAWEFWRQHAHLFRYTDYVVNISGDRDIREPATNLVRRALVSETTHVIHSAALAMAVKRAFSDGHEMPAPANLVPVAKTESNASLHRPAGWVSPIKSILRAIPAPARALLRRVYFALPPAGQRGIRRVLGR